MKLIKTLMYDQYERRLQLSRVITCYHFFMYSGKIKYKVTKQRNLDKKVGQLLKM